MNPLQQAQSISREKLQRLIARVQQTSPPESPPAEVGEFDWTYPHRFGSEPRQILEKLGSRLALSVQKGLNEQLSQTIETELTEIREHCAYRLVQQTSQGMEGPYVVGLRNDAKQCVSCLIFSFETASFLVAQMLNDPEAAIGQNGQFSALEESILLDMALVLNDLLGDILQEHLQLSLLPVDHVVRGDWVMRARVIEDLCEFSFRLKVGEQDISFSLVLESTLLDTYAGVPVKPIKNPEQDSARILERLRKAPVSVCANVSTDLIRFRDLAQLEPGDILVLGKKARAPLEVVLNGRRCFHAYPAVRKEKIALIMTESINEYE